MSEIIQELDKKIKEEGYIDISPKKEKYLTERQKFMKKLIAKQQECTSKKIPFDFARAKYDFEKKQVDGWSEGRRGDATNVYEVEVKLNIDFYSDKKHFKILKESFVTEKRMVSGTLVPLKVKFIDYWSKLSGARYSIQEPDEETMNRFLGKDKKV